MFIYKTAKFSPVWCNILKLRAIFVHQTLTLFDMGGHHAPPPQKKEMFVTTVPKRLGVGS